MKLGKLTVRLRGRRAPAGACATVDWPRLAEALEPSRGRALRLIRRGVLEGWRSQARSCVSKASWDRVHTFRVQRRRESSHSSKALPVL